MISKQVVEGIVEVVPRQRDSYLYSPHLLFAYRVLYTLPAPLVTEADHPRQSHQHGLLTDPGHTDLWSF